jgi:hypothetical protein
MMTIQAWQAEAETLASLVEELPSRLQDLAALPQGESPERLLPVLLKVRRDFKVATPNTSLTPVDDRLAGVHEHLRPSLSALLRNVEHTLSRCVAAGARDPGIVAASDFGDGLLRLDVPGIVGLVLLGQLRALPEDHVVRRSIGLAEGYVPSGATAGPCLVLGKLLGGGFPGETLPVRAGAWYDLAEAVSTTRRWRQAQLAREEERRAAEERERQERADWEREWRQDAALRAAAALKLAGK